MSQPGDSVTLTVARQTAAGAASTGKVVGDFTVHINGASASLTNFTDVGTAGVWRIYQFDVTLPSTAQHNLVTIQPASGTDVIAPDMLFGEIESYDLSALAALFLTSEGTVVATSAADTDLGQVVDGDSWNTGTLVIPLSKLSKIGLSDLSDCTISAALQQEPDDGTVVTSGNTGDVLTATISSEANREVNAGWTTWPTEMSLGTGDRSATWYLDIQIKHTSSGKILTGYRGQLEVVWERDPTT